jgi:two-component sensor histidine kinase
VALRSPDEGVLISDLLRRELAPYRVRGRATLEGGPVRLTPAAAQSLSMVLHELATNAAKYGSLSRAGGKLFVTWSLLDNSNLSLVWKEATEDGGGGMPRREEGFGSMLLRRLISDLGGSFARRWDEAGMVATIVLGAAYVAPPRRRRGPRPQLTAANTRSETPDRSDARKEAWR